MLSDSFNVWEEIFDYWFYILGNVGEFWIKIKLFLSEYYEYFEYYYIRI